jgi:hypothetical protein
MRKGSRSAVAGQGRVGQGRELGARVKQIVRWEGV